jgi:hypothetical protein
MTERAHPRAAEREVQVSFEPSRTAATCLLLAYVRLVPIRRRRLQLSSGPATAVETPPQRVEARRG